MDTTTNNHFVHGQAPFIPNVDIERIKFVLLPTVTDSGTQRLGDMDFLCNAIERALARVIKNPPIPKRPNKEFITIEMNYGSMAPGKTAEFFKELCKILGESKYVERLYLYGEDMRSLGFQIYKHNPTITYIRYGIKASAGEEQ